MVKRVPPMTAPPAKPMSAHEAVCYLVRLPETADKTAFLGQQFAAIRASAAAAERERCAKAVEADAETCHVSEATVALRWAAKNLRTALARAEATPSPQPLMRTEE